MVLLVCSRVCCGVRVTRLLSASAVFLLLLWLMIFLLVLFNRCVLWWFCCSCMVLGTGSRFVCGILVVR